MRTFAENWKQKLKYRLRSCLDLIAAITGLLQWHERRMRTGLTILMYHRVLPFEECVDYPLPALVIPVEAFRQQMQFLADHCRVLPVREALEEFSGGGAFVKPIVAVTFDDGYMDNFTLAAPALEECGLRGTFFVTSGFVADGRPQWYDRAAVAWQLVAEENRRLLLEILRQARGELLEEEGAVQRSPAWMAGLKLAAPAFRQELLTRSETYLEHSPDFSLYQPMSPEQVASLHGRGHEIASHTVSHPILPQLTEKALAAELHKSKEQLKTWIGAAITGFCYPNGDYDSRVELAVAKAGYRYACTVKEGINRPGVCPTRLARLPITMQRTMWGTHHDRLGFRAELSRLRTLWRKRN